MSGGVLGHERQLTFFPQDGHNHDGQNSTPVVMPPGSIGIDALNEAVLDWIRDQIGGGEGPTGEGENGGFVPVPDLKIETAAVGPGASVTGTVDWTGIAVIRFMRVFMTTDSECTITFYHQPTFAEEDREFRARRCANKFLWEGAWVHYDESNNKQLHYKIENTGNATTAFQLTLKSGTLVANGYARFVESLSVNGTQSIGNVQLVQGNGVQLSYDEASNSVIISAVAPQTITIDRYATVPRRHTAVTSSTTITTTGNGLNGGGSTAAYVQFGTGNQWINVDFGAVYTAGKVVVVAYPDGRTVNGMKIESSTDGNNWTELMATQSVPATYHGVEISMPAGFNIRYVRVWENGTSVNTSNYVSEVMIYTISNKVGS